MHFLIIVKIHVLSRKTEISLYEINYASKTEDFNF